MSASAQSSVKPAADAPKPMNAGPPVVPGFHRLADAKADDVAKGQLLLGEMNCLSCHKADAARVQARPAPDLSQAASRLTPQFLKVYLTDPHAAKPGTVMPDVFHASEGFAKDGAVDALVHYLSSLGEPMKMASAEGTPLDVEAGDRLFHSVGCVACHAPRDKEGKPVATKFPSIPLPDLASKTTVDQLAAFLKEPHIVRPGGRMPSLELASDEARSIAIYLLKDQLKNPQANDAPPVVARGLKVTYWEAAVKDVKLETLDKLKAPARTFQATVLDAKIPGARSGNWVAKFAGQLAVPKDGKYTFHVTSDDGTRLFIGGKEVLENDGIHPPTEKKAQVDLKAGPTPFVLTFFQGGGGAELKVEWQGPGIKRGPIPADALSSADGRPMIPTGTVAFQRDAQKVQMGKMMFGALGCASCHQVEGTKPAPMKEYPPLAGLNVDAAEGCLGDNIRKAVPNYRLSADQKTALKAAIKDAGNKDAGTLAKQLDAKDQVVRGMAALNCYACHKRGDVGGPTEDADKFFTMKAEFDMGDEGRVPPALTNAGLKLKQGALEKIVTEAKLHVRQVLATRMPRFEKAHTKEMLAAFEKADEPAAARLVYGQPQFDEQAAKDGRLLFGTKGLGCVNCHGVLGNKSLGMPAPDLTTAHERLRFDWYSRLMHDPAVVTPGTRMPGFFAGGVSPLPTVAKGDAQAQIAAMYQYLSLGTSMALPAGLSGGNKTELVAVDEPILHRTFFADVGPRAVLVGYPEQLSVAFDGNLVRLATVWRGRFFDAKGLWDGRGGAALPPLGTGIVKLPAVQAVAALPDAAAPWPVPTARPEDGKFARSQDVQFLGYELDKEKRPAFRYRIGTVEVSEQPTPKLQPGGAQLIRKFTVTGSGDNVYLMLAAGKAIEAKGDDFVVDGNVAIRVTGPAATKPILRDAKPGDGKTGKELILRLPTGANPASFDVEMVW